MNLRLKSQVPLDKAPRHAAALGRLVAHWAVVESQVGQVLQGLLGDVWRARIIFEHFRGFGDKLGLVMRLVHTFVADGAEKAALLSLLDTAGKLNTERNKHVHAMWAPASRGKMARFQSNMPRNLRQRRHPLHIVTVKDIQRVTDDMAALSADLEKFMFDSWGKLSISERPLN